MNKILYLSVLLILFTKSINSFGQLKGKIIDSENGVYIPDVIITNIKNNTVKHSKQDGTFEVDCGGKYSFKKEGYFEGTFNIFDKTFNIIQLTVNPAELNEIIVNANLLPKIIKESTSTINIITSKNIELNNNTDVSLLLNKTPGVFMQSGALNTNRITIRGIGARNLFGTSKIRAYFKDIPLTSGSGDTNIEDFELGAMSRIEIIKGASSIYGAGLGGTIQLTAENAYLNQSTIENELLVGSFGLMKGVTKLNYGNNKNGFKAIYSNTHSDGFRENNQYDRQTLTISTNHFINEKDELSVLASYVNLKAFIPSSINENDYINEPESAAFTWSQAKGFEDSKRGLLGVSWQHDYSSKIKQSTSIFTSFRNGYEPRPFNILTEKTLAYGFRTRLIGQTKFFNKNLSWTFGGEVFEDIYKSGTFQNLYKDFPPGKGSVKGNRLSNFREKRNYFNVFLESNYDITKTTIVSIGLNYNQTSYNLKDNFEITLTNPDQSGSFKFDEIISPKFGVLQKLIKSVNLYANASNGFSPISLKETLLPNGQVNTDLKPETGWNFEIGTRGSFLENRIQFNASLFRMDIKNLLVTKRISEDQYFSINAGKTLHDGLELNINYNVLEEENLSINSFITYTLNNFSFKEFIDDNNNFSGNDLTGVPSDIFNTGVSLSSSMGIYGNIHFQYVGSMPITDSNSLYSDNYNLTNLKVGYKKNINKNLNLNMFLGINNIFGTVYASQLLINATGFGGSAPRYYYPGNPRNYYTGLSINYNF